eukprot:gene16042-17664_t
MEAGKHLSNLREVALLSGQHEGPTRAVRFNSDGNYCMTCGSDKTLKLWNPHTSTLLKTYIGHGLEVLDAISSTLSDRLASCGADKAVILWDVATGKAIRRFRGHSSKINCVKANKDDFTVLVSGSYDTTVRCWDTRSRSQDPMQVLDEARDSISSIQVSEHSILTGSVDGFAREYDLRLGKMTDDCLGEPVTSVSFTNDGQCILVSSLDHTIRLMDRSSGEMLNSFKGHQNSTYKIDSCLSNNDCYVVSGSEDGRICFWDLIEGNLVHSLEHGSKEVVYSLSVHPEGDCLLSASSNSVKLWKVDGDNT